MNGHPVILFDGVCNLCNGFVQFVIRHDPEQHFRFASLQSEAGAALLREHGMTPGDLGSMVLCADGRCWVRSDAALGVLARLPGIWKWMGGLRCLPRGLRDWGYGVVAGNRYRWFGRQTECWLPTPELRERFL